MRVSVLSLAFLGGAAAFAPLPAPTTRSVSARVAPICAAQNDSPILQPFNERRALKVRIYRASSCRLHSRLREPAPKLRQ